MAQRSLVVEATRPLVLITVSVLLGLLCYLYYKFVHSPYQAFSGTGVKGPNPRILLGNSLQLLAMGEMQTYHKYFKTYGPIFGFYKGTRPVVVVTDPVLVDMVLCSEQNSFTTTHHQEFLKSTLRVHGLPAGLPLPQQQRLQQHQRLESEDTLKARKGFRSILMLPRLLKLMVPVVLQNFDTLLLETLKNNLSNPSVDVWSVYESYCLQVVLGIVGLSSGKHGEEVARALREYFSVANRSGTLELMFRALFGSVPCFEEVVKVLNRRAKAEEEFSNLVGAVSSAVHEAKQHHQNTGIKRNYLQVLLDQSLTEDQTVSYCLLILLLGYHSTLTTLSAATYHLATDPMTQQKLYSELSTSVQREALFYETVDSLEFLDAVVQETLRLCCLTPKLTRVCVKDCGLKGVTVPKGTRVEIPLSVIHHLPTTWNNPHSFSPDRFTTPQKPSPNDKAAKCPVAAQSSAFLPFGLGAHSCVGMRLTVNCVKLTLTEVIQRFRFTRPANGKEPQECASPFRRWAGGHHVRVATRHKFKRSVSFATVVKTAMDKQPDDDNDDTS